jgi:large subunit ribosomal protein L23
MAKAKKAEDTAAIKDVYYTVITRPIITEKATMLSEQNKVVFKIAPDATKVQVKQAVEALFKVNVVSVNTINVEGKKKAFRNRMGKRDDFKKAIVTLAKGQSIDLSSGVA